MRSLDVSLCVHYWLTGLCSHVHKFTKIRLYFTIHFATFPCFPCSYTTLLAFAWKCIGRQAVSGGGAEEKRPCSYVSSSETHALFTFC